MLLFALQKCLNAISKTQHSMQRINIYDIYADVCLPKHAHSEVTQLALQLGRHPATSGPAIAKPGANGVEFCSTNPSAAVNLTSATKLG